jgi:hypothetical protein
MKAAIARLSLDGPTFSPRLAAACRRGALRTKKQRMAHALSLWAGRMHGPEARLHCRAPISQSPLNLGLAQETSEVSLATRAQ